MQVFMKKNIWSITAGWSRVITIWTTVLAYHTWADDNDDPEQAQ